MEERNYDKSEQNPDAVTVVDVEDLINITRGLCGIPTFSGNMSDDEIATVCRYIGEHAPNNTVIDGRIAIGAEGFDAMLFVTLTEFPRFFDRYNLWTVWRN